MNITDKDVTENKSDNTKNSCEQPQESSSRLNPIKLNRNSKFQFACHKGVKCFTTCCKDINLILTPYDIVRLKHRLGLSSEEFLAIYTKPELLVKTDLPVITLKMLDDKEKSCPFVRTDGCIIYSDRPNICRYYPLGIGILAKQDDVNDKEDFYFFVEEKHCLGFYEDKTWTVADWIKNEGVEKYDDINAGWYELIVMKRSYPPNLNLTEKTKALFFMTCYNIDQFKRFVFESDFLKLYSVDQGRISTIEQSEDELLKFGFSWIKWLLFKQGNFSINEEVIEKRKSKIKPM